MPAVLKRICPKNVDEQCIEGVDHPSKELGALGLKLSHLRTHHGRQNHPRRFTRVRLVHTFT